MRVSTPALFLRYFARSANKTTRAAYWRGNICTFFVVSREARNRGRRPRNEKHAPARALAKPQSGAGESLAVEQNRPRKSEGYFGRLVDAGGFGPPKRKRNRFTVCPLWPLGNASGYTCDKEPSIYDQSSPALFLRVSRSETELPLGQFEQKQC